MSFYLHFRNHLIYPRQEKYWIPLPVAFLYSNLRSFHWKKQSGVKINDLCIGTENIFISPRHSSRMGECRGEFFAKKELL